MKNMKGRGHFEDLSLDGRIITNGTLSKYDTRVWIGLNGLSRGSSSEMP
jgi:hypothetical protein